MKAIAQLTASVATCDYCNAFADAMDPETGAH